MFKNIFKTPTIKTNNTDTSKKKTQKNDITIPLRKRITNYILKKGDICCEKDFNRTKVINEIFKVYNNDLDSINNDVYIFIGYFADLSKARDKVGIELHKELDKLMPNIKNKDKDKINITLVLKDMPLFYLLSFLGMAHYKKIP